MEPWRFRCSHNFDKVLDPDQHRSEKSDPDPHQSDQPNPQHCGFLKTNSDLVIPGDYRGPAQLTRLLECRNLTF
jgi:hypothetical protein